MFEDKIGGVRIIIDCQSGWRPNEDMKMCSAPSFGAPGSLIFVVAAQLLKTKKTSTKLVLHRAAVRSTHTHNETFV